MNIFSFLNHCYHFKSIDSTSSYLKRNYNRFKNMTFVVADYQSNGRGRNNRTWVSDKNANLLFSFLIKDKKLVERFDSLSILTAVVIKKSLEKLGLNNIYIKWPNDVYVNDEKICGILLDGVSNYNELDAVIIGVGLNINQKDFPNDLLRKATSISKCLNKDVSKKQVEKIIFKQVKKDFKHIESSNYLNIARESNYLKNKEVYVEINNEKKLVKVIDISDDNALLVELDNKIIPLKSGEVTFHL